MFDTEGKDEEVDEGVNTLELDEGQVEYKSRSGGVGSWEETERYLAKLEKEEKEALKK